MTGSKSKSTSTSGSAQEWAKPYATSAASEIQSVYDANKPQLEQQIANVNALGDTLNTAYSNAGKTGSTAQGYYNNVLSGDYLDGNPYIQGMIDASSKDIINNVGSTYQSAGRYGSASHDTALANALAEMENQYRYQNYATERGYQQDAAAGSVSADQAKAQAQQAAAQQLLAQQALAAELPYTGMNNLANALGTLFNGGTSTSTSKSSILGDIIGAAGTVGAAAVPSDPRLKHNAVRVADFDDGLGLWEYSYLGSDEREFGVMADEVAQLRPWALGPEWGGFMTVNYDMLEAA